jgi:eukaryotic translation initiation factor 2C
MVNNKMMDVKARILPPPRLIYGSNRTMSPRDGKWNLRGLAFLKPSTIKSWVLVYLPSRKPLANQFLEKFGQDMVGSFRACGLSVPRAPPPVLVGNAQAPMNKIMEDARARAHNQFGVPPTVIFIVFQGSSIPLYKTLKAGLDVHMGIASQVMLEEKAFSG